MRLCEASQRAARRFRLLMRASPKDLCRQIRKSRINWWHRNQVPSSRACSNTSEWADARPSSNAQLPLVWRTLSARSPLNSRNCARSIKSARSSSLRPARNCSLRYSASAGRPVDCSIKARPPSGIASNERRIMRRAAAQPSEYSKYRPMTSGPAKSPSSSMASCKVNLRSSTPKSDTSPESRIRASGISSVSRVPTIT